MIILSCCRLTKYICVAGRVGSLKSLLKQALTDTEELLDNLPIISNTKDAEFKHIQRYKLDRSSRLLHKKSWILPNNFPCNFECSFCHDCTNRKFYCSFGSSENDVPSSTFKSFPWITCTYWFMCWRRFTALLCHDSITSR